MRELSPERRNLLTVLYKRPYELFFLLPGSVMPVISYAGRKATAYCRLQRSSASEAGNRAPRLSGITTSVNKKHCFLDKLPAIALTPPQNKESQFIRLAGETISITQAIDWGHAYPDIEDCFALNRFGWLLDIIMDCPSVKTAENALSYIESWLSAMSEKKDHPAWESYSVSERLSNWPYILLIARELTPVPDELTTKVERAIFAHLEHLLCHIEHRGGFTNNHILNNARGLYTGGLLTGHQKALEKARGLFYYWTERLFHEDGMLKEHSSHYQHLLCQRYEQIHLLSLHSGDKAFSDFMSKWSSLMSMARDFFLVRYPETSPDFPLIGDISPDFKPGWLIPGSDRGWSKLKKWLRWQDSEQHTPVKKNGLAVKKGGFFRYDIADVAIFWHIETEGMTYLSHGHYDIGGFILFNKGAEIFADPGRYTYSEPGSYGKSARAHSTMLIDSLGAYCEDSKLNALKAYRFQNAAFNVSEAGGNFALEITINGFKRLRTPVLWKRKFIVEKTRMVIYDMLESRGDNYVETRFQIAPGVKTSGQERGINFFSDQGAEIQLEVKDGHAYKCVLHSGSSEDEKEGWFSKEYGERSSGTSVVFQRELHKLQTHIYEIRW